MEKFKEAFKRTEAIEGGYVNDSDDVGGETYKGISRVYHPVWQGWSLIDQYRDFPNFPSNLEENKLLQNMIEIFYKQKYWDVYKLDNPAFSQKLANELYDSGVNMGTGRVSKFLQKALNYLNRNEKLFTNLEEDGKIGSLTLSALNKVMPKDEETLLKILNVLQGMQYLNYTDRKPTQKKYIRGWFRRISF